MGFLDVATEIRLKIYSELLVCSEPILVADHSPLLPPLFRSRKDGLHPAVLRLSKMVYSEASPLLYSNNRFRFPEVFGSTSSVPTHAHVAPFLIQIRLQARLLHHICIPFPTFDPPIPDRARLDEAHVKNLELIRKTCTNIKTLETLIEPEHCNYALSHSAIAAEALDVLNTRFQAIHSLKEIIINFEKYPEEDPSDDLTKKMRDMGWTVRVTRLPKRVWISNDDRFEFDDPDDRNAYDDEQFRREEKKSWLKENDRRRQDPYWKNDSDYD